MLLFHCLSWPYFLKREFFQADELVVFFFLYQSVLLWTGLFFPVCRAAITLSARHSGTWKNKLYMIIFIQTFFDTHFKNVPAGAEESF